MITVKDLAKKLTAYARISPDTEIMLAFDGDVAFSFERGDDHSAFGAGGLNGEGQTYKFLVLHPDIKGKKLVLKGSI